MNTQEDVNSLTTSRLHTHGRADDEFRPRLTIQMLGTYDAISMLLITAGKLKPEPRDVIPAVSGGNLARAKRMLALDSRPLGCARFWYIPHDWKGKLRSMGLEADERSLRFVDEVAFIERYRRYDGRIARRQEARKQVAEMTHAGLSKHLSGLRREGP